MNLARLGKLEITEEKLFYLEEKHFHFQFLDKPFYNRLPLYYQGRVSIFQSINESEEIE